jgi:hypothetical protein
MPNACLNRGSHRRSWRSQRFRRRTVKPPAQPTQVRTLDLPPARTAPDLHLRSGVSLLGPSVAVTDGDYPPGAGGCSPQMRPKVDLGVFAGSLASSKGLDALQCLVLSFMEEAKRRSAAALRRAWLYSPPAEPGTVKCDRAVVPQSRVGFRSRGPRRALTASGLTGAVQPGAVC